jgi:hypothetical protein
LKIESEHYSAVLDEAHGGCFTSFIDSASGKEALGGPGNDLILYADSGGLWRMGCEFAGGNFSELARASDSPASLRAVGRHGVLEVTVKSMLGHSWITRLMWFAPDSRLIWMRTMASLGDYRTLTCGFTTAFNTPALSMDVTGGVVDRPVVKTYDPTFWSAQSFVHYRDVVDGPGLAVFFAIPATVSASSGSRIEWVLARNAKRERAFGFLPLVAHPANGADPSVQVVDYAVCLSSSGDWRDNGLHLMVDDAVAPLWRNRKEALLRKRAEGAVTVDNADVRVMSVSPAQSGEETIVRLFSYAGEPLTVHLEAASREISKASLCDAHGRELQPLEVKAGRAVVPVARSITSVRLTL